MLNFIQHWPIFLDCKYFSVTASAKYIFGDGGRNESSQFAFLRQTLFLSMLYHKMMLQMHCFGYLNISTFPSLRASSTVSITLFNFSKRCDIIEAEGQLRKLWGGAVAILSENSGFCRILDKILLYQKAKVLPCRKIVDFLLFPNVNAMVKSFAMFVIIFISNLFFVSALSTFSDFASWRPLRTAYHL